MTFTSEPVKLEKVPPAVAKDPWLIVTEVKEEIQSSKVQKFNPKL